MSRSLPSLGFLFVTLTVLLCSSLIFVERLPAQDPAPPPATGERPAKTDTSAQPAQAPAPPDGQEVSSRDTPATFKVRVNMVLVRVVVRDAQGKAVPNLKKEDFQLFDGKKLQAISSFTIETPQAHTASAAASSEAGFSSSADPIAGKAVALPQRFVSMIFDDIHLSMEDVTFVRNAATKFLSSMAASDRLAITSTSGQLTQEFTNDQEVLRKALLGIVPRPLTIHASSDCPDMSYYEADLIVNKNDAQALAVATDEALQCAFNGDPTRTAQAQTLARSAAFSAIGQGDSETDYTYRHLEDAVRRMVNLPGQRIVVLVSPGFILTTLQSNTYDLIDRAMRANIVINTIDARGLYTPELGGDIANPSRDTLRTAGVKSLYRVSAQNAQFEVLAQLADGTGGTFFHNRNDVDEGMREAAAAPAVSYLLGFAPQNLKIDGRYHTLKVALASKQKFNIQARHGYYAPRSIADPAEAAKQEIQEALFSQEEIRDLPIDFQTQFFKKEQADARLAVLTHLDVKGIRFRKALGRNNDQLTIVTGIFDENGQYVTGGEKIIDMKLRDTTYDRLSRSGFIVKSSFDVKPGTYLVRLVVRDAEGSQMAARNGAVVIPY
jgi:VWFA-related protein